MISIDFKSYKDMAWYIWSPDTKFVLRKKIWIGFKNININYRFNSKDIQLKSCCLASDI